MHRGLAVVRSTLLVVVVAAGLQLASTGPVVASTVPFPGQIFVAPSKVDRGSTDTLTFTYTPGSHRLTNGTVSVHVPTGWTAPQGSASGSPGFVRANLGGVVIVKRMITVQSLTLCRTCSLVLSYGDVSPPSTPGLASFATKVSMPGQPSEKVHPVPTVRVRSFTVATTTTTSTTTTTTTSTTLPCDGQPVTATSGGVSMTVTPATCLVGGAVVTISGSGFDPSSSGVILQCNDSPGQPTVTISVVGNAETYPVSCTPLVFAHVITTDASGNIPAGKTLTVIAGTTGPPCGAGSLAPTCPMDSASGDPVADAANYPCPPTPAQQAEGASCTLNFADNRGKSQSVGLSFGAPS